MMKNEREFKLKVYPSLGFSLIFPFIFMLNDLKDKGWSGIASSKMYLNIYFCAILLPTAVMMIKYSGKYKGAWIYKIIPNKDISSIFKGTLKAFIVRLLLPVYFIEAVIFMTIFGVRIFPDLILVFLNIMLFTVVCFKVTKKSLPFSEGFGVSQGSEGLIVIPLMIMLGILALIHYNYTKVNYGVYVFSGIILIVNIILWKKSFNIPLEKIDS